MKTILTKSVIGTTLAVALALAAWIPAGTQGAPAKGAEKLLGSKASAPVAETAASTDAHMACGKCKNEAVTQVTTVKGHIQTATVSEQHACPGCSTTIGVTGAGKARTDVVRHACEMARVAPASCCK